MKERRLNIELNLYYMHSQDARVFALLAEQKSDDGPSPSIYARHSIIATVFASEALINRVLLTFAKDKNLYKCVEKNSITQKWLLAPALCSFKQNISCFKQDSEPFQSFSELIKIRNWFAHPKTETFVPGQSEANSTISVMGSNEKYPWLTVLKGKVWPQTKIPKNPFEINASHANQAIEIFNSMKEGLNNFLDGAISQKWLDEITVKGEDGKSPYNAPVHTIWDGYAGVKE